LAVNLRERLPRRLRRERIGNLLFRETLLLHANLEAGWRPKCPRQLAVDLAQESKERPMGQRFHRFRVVNTRKDPLLRSPSGHRSVTAFA
jgi:hypothetical protein